MSRNVPGTIRRADGESAGRPQRQSPRPTEPADTERTPRYRSRPIPHQQRQANRGDHERVSLVFCSSTGTPLSHSNFRRRVWLPALATVGLEGVHVHDLRHTGNQLTPNTGANPKELMARMGHDSERAALIYLHSSAGRRRTLADVVGRMAAAELAKSKTAKPSGTLTARKPNGPDGPADRKSPDLRK
jgi:integrase